MHTEDVLLIIEQEPDVEQDLASVLCDLRMPVHVEVARDEAAFWRLHVANPDAPVLVGRVPGSPYDLAQDIKRRCPERVVAVLDDEGVFESNGVQPTKRKSLPSMLPFLFMKRDLARVQRRVSGGFRHRVAA